MIAAAGPPYWTNATVSNCSKGGEMAFQLYKQVFLVWLLFGSAITDLSVVAVE
jgi:hypothetical protein